MQTKSNTNIDGEKKLWSGRLESIRDRLITHGAPPKFILKFGWHVFKDS